MPAYLIVDVDVTDPEKFERYRLQVAPTLERYGGTFLVRGARSRFSRESGSRSAWSCCASRAPPAPGSGGAPRSIALPSSSDRRPRART